MSQKLLINCENPEDEAFVREAGAEILVQYPHCLLVSCASEQSQKFKNTHLEVSGPEQPPPRILQALEATDEDNSETLSEQVAYYLVKVIGPFIGEWLEFIRDQGGTILDNFPGYVLVISLRPNKIHELRRQAWVEAVCPYHAAFDPETKLSPRFRQSLEKKMTMVERAAIDSLEQIEICLRTEPDWGAIADRIKSSGGRVLTNAEMKETMIAIAPIDLIEELVKRRDIQAILPHTLATLHNDRAAEVMEAHIDYKIGEVTLKGEGQIVAVADGGFDTGDPNNIEHPDFQGRVRAIRKWPVDPTLHEEDFKETIEGAPVDDSAEDKISHGTHVAGSILGDGTAAKNANAPYIPQGIAPKAELFFQSVGYVVKGWKKEEELERKHKFWPPAERQTLWGLPDKNITALFEQAYYEGKARIHTNSWGKPDPLGGYTNQSKAVDEFMWNHRDMLILFAAGNEGRDTVIRGEPPDGKINHNSITPPGTAKNCVTVGACENKRPPDSDPQPGLNIKWTAYKRRYSGSFAFSEFSNAHHVSDDPDEVAPLSSRGVQPPPSEPEKIRVKPDVVAPGTNILSTRSTRFAPSVISRADPNLNEKAPGWGSLKDEKFKELQKYYHWHGGSSMSTPLVAGAAALIRQYLIEKGHFEDKVKPSGALIKAFLINGAQRMKDHDEHEPNWHSGFGRVSLAEAFLPDTQFYDEPDGAVTSGETRLFEVKIIDCSTPLKVTLVWTDKPSELVDSGNSGLISIRNRLLLAVLGEGEEPQYSNTPQNNAQRIIKKPKSGVDTYIIQVQGVCIEAHSPGVHRASNDKNPYQDFALVVSNAASLMPINER